MKLKLTKRQQAGMRWAAVWLASFLAVLLLVPGLLVRGLPPSGPVLGQAGQDGEAAEEAVQGPWIPVYRAKESKTQPIRLEAYVLGVVAAEMPIEFAPEALKAQALAARTYIVRRMQEGERGQTPDGATVTDTTAHQAYAADEELRERWGTQYGINRDKLAQAVAETRGFILTYGGQPIEASFFSTSNGYTENSEDYWSWAVPYLRSVPSPWDVALSPKYKETLAFTPRELQEKLGLPSALPVSAGQAAGWKTLERSAGHRIKKLSVGGRIFTGRELREKLELRSSQFDWRWEKGRWLLTTYGYGHGVGMSQWGAQGMALEGKKAEEIVKYYYTGVQVEPMKLIKEGKSSKS